MAPTEISGPPPRTGLDQLCSSEEEESDAQLQAWHLMCAFAAPMAVKAACMLRIPDLLAREGPLTLEEIASRLSSQAPNTDYLHRILMFLCMKGVFSVEMVQNPVGLRADPKFCITPVSKFLVQEKNEPSLGAMALLMTSMEGQAAYHQMSECILRGGVPFERAHGTDVWGFANLNPSFSKLFNDAMAGGSDILMKSILEHYRGFDDVDTLVDVGGGTGTAISRIKAQYPSIRAINFDLPHVVASAPSSPGVEHVGGDMLKSVPSAGAIFLKWIMHSWDDEGCRTILRNCKKAIPETGKLIIVDMVLQMDMEPANALEEQKSAFDLMIRAMSSGKERTSEQWGALLTAAGFPRYSVVHLPSNQWSVIEAFPAA